MSNTLTAELVSTAEIAAGTPSSPAGDSASNHHSGTPPASASPSDLQQSSAGGGKSPLKRPVARRVAGDPAPVAAKLVAVPSTTTVSGQASAAAQVAVPAAPPVMLAKPVAHSGDPASDDFADEVYAGLRLGISRLVTAAGISMLVHCILLTVLGVLAVRDVRPEVVLLASKLEPKEALLVEIPPPQALPTPPPIVAKVDTTPKKNAGISPGAMARGIGSAGANRGLNGGNQGGMQMPSLKIDSVQKLASGGSGGLGADRAFGKDMLGEAGDPVPSGATFFGVKADGRSFAFVVDTSGSMSNNGRYLRCREELLRSVAALHYRQKYFIVFFNHGVFPMPDRQLVEARPNQIRQTMAWITGAMPTGFTDPWPGLLMAIRMKPDAIYLLTDGEFDAAVIEKVIAAQPASKKIPIHTIAFESEAGVQTLQTISRVTGGTYRHVP